MPRLRLIGFFYEHPADRCRHVLQGLAATEPQPDQENILTYLSNGLEVLIYAGLSRDHLDPAEPVLGAPRVLTDGIWAWTSDLAYYVRRYNLRLSADFVSHMKRNQWQPPFPVNIEGIYAELSQVSSDPDAHKEGDA